MENTKKEGRFEWIVDWPALSQLLTPQALGLAVSASVLDVGCGTSSLAVQLAGSGYACVTAVDREVSCVEHMRAQHIAQSVRWLVCDVTKEESAALLPDSSCDLIVDKGMLDCALVRLTLLHTGIPDGIHPCM